MTNEQPTAPPEPITPTSRWPEPEAKPEPQAQPEPETIDSVRAERDALKARLEKLIDRRQFRADVRTLDLQTRLRHIEKFLKARPKHWEAFLSATQWW